MSVAAAKPRAIILLGFRQAGMDVLARALVAAGASLPGDASGDPNEFGTSRSITRLNTRLLESLGIDLDDPGPLSISGKTLAESREEIARHLPKTKAKRARALIANAAPAGSTTILTGPQMMLLLPFWRAVIGEAGIDARYVHLVRNPMAIADIRRTESQLSSRHSQFLWQYLTLEVLANAPDADLVHATDLSEAPDAVVREMLGGETLPALVALQPHSQDTAALAEIPSISVQTRELWKLLRDWREIDPEHRLASIADLRDRLDESVLATGGAKPIKLGAKSREADAKKSISVRSRPVVTAPIKPLILHYHLFKNAGSSIDAMLKANFGDRWIDHEFPPRGHAKNRIAVPEFIAAHGEIDAFSSHTALLPVPEVEGRAIFPVIFVRHPLLRLRSAYGFERRQTADTPGSKLAKENDFAGYISALLNEPRNRQARDFQTIRFAFGTPGGRHEELKRALATVERLPFVGLVEDYEDSIARLTALLKPLFPAFESVIAHKNAGDAGDTRPFAQKLEDVRIELGSARYDEVVEVNRNDIALFEHVRAKYETLL